MPGSVICTQQPTAYGVPRNLIRAAGTPPVTDLLRSCLSII
nr:MAG TPA: hypothetical protein [Caudoviricetes sp.]